MRGRLGDSAKRKEKRFTTEGTEVGEEESTEKRKERLTQRSQRRRGRREAKRRDWGLRVFGRLGDVQGGWGVRTYCSRDALFQTYDCI